MYRRFNRKSRVAPPGKGALATMALASSLGNAGSGGFGNGSRHLAVAASVGTETPSGGGGAVNDEEGRRIQETNGGRLKRLATVFEGEESSAGAMFDMKAKSSPIIIRGMDIGTVHDDVDGSDGGRGRVLVWTKRGSYRGHEYHEDSWTLWMNETLAAAATSAGTDEGDDDVLTYASPTLFAPLEVRPKEKRAFYVAVTHDGHTRLRRGDAKGGRKYYINHDMYIQGNGVAKGGGGGSFSGPVSHGSLFNGALYYESVPPTPSPTPAPTDAPSASPTWSPRQVRTTFEGDATYAGHMFDVVARQDVSISSMGFHTWKRGEDVAVSLYTRDGTYADADKDASRWTLVTTVTVEGMGLGEPTYIPEGSFEPILVRKKSRQAFYITSDGPYLRAAKKKSNAKMSRINSDMIIYEGAGKRYPIEKQTIPNRTWNGVIQYQRVVIPSAAPTLSPSASPTDRPEDFRLRLYWERGYYWQETRSEMWFCVECNGGCRSGASLMVDRCSRSDGRQRFVSMGDTLRPADNTDLCFTSTGYNERDPMRLYPCGGDRARRQSFVGFKPRGKFELQPRGDSSRCVSQMHHPKPYERIYPEVCRKTRDHE